MNKTLTSYMSIDFWNGFLGRWSTKDGNPELNYIIHLTNWNYQSSAHPISSTLLW